MDLFFLGENMCNRVLAVAATAVLGLTLAGCGKQDSTPPAATPTTPAAQAQPAAPAPAAAMSEAVKTAVDTAKTTAVQTASAAADTAKTTAANAVADAQSLLNQVTQDTKDKKWDLADSGLKKLEGMKASLPAEWSPRIDQARKAFDVAKAAGSLPGLGG